MRKKTGSKLDRICNCGHTLDGHSKIPPHRCTHRGGCVCIAFDSPTGDFSKVRFDDPDDE